MRTEARLYAANRQVADRALCAASVLPTFGMGVGLGHQVNPESIESTKWQPRHLEPSVT